MVAFIQIGIEEKVGKNNRILRPLKRDPAIEVSAYRDNQFKVVNARPLGLICKSHFANRT